MEKSPNRPRPYPSIRVFKNPLLESLTHVHPIVPLIIWLPISLFCMGRNLFLNQFGGWEWLACIGSGLFLWTWVEYMLHRFVYHLEGNSAWAKKLHFLIHGIHHADPQDPTRLVMPPAGSAILGVLFYGLFTALMGKRWGEPFFGAFVGGYLIYDYVHYSVHHFKIPTRFGYALKHNHMQHHYVLPNSRWGVSSPLWDVIMGTMHEKPSTSAREVQVRPEKHPIVTPKTEGLDCGALS